MTKLIFSFFLRAHTKRAQANAVRAMFAAAAFVAAIARSGGDARDASRTPRGFLALARLVWVVAAARTSARSAREAAEVVGGVHAFAAAYAAEEAAHAANREFHAAIRG